MASPKRHFTMLLSRLTWAMKAGSRALGSAAPNGFDAVVVGGGIGGACVAAALASQKAKVLIIEGEEQPGYHSTGRSAALYCQTYGSPAMRALTVASHRHFTETLPSTAGFDPDVPLLTPRGVLHLARAEDVEALRAYRDECAVLTPGVRSVSVEEACQLCPALKSDAFAEAFIEEEAMDMDVGAIHQGMLAAAKLGGAVVMCSTRLIRGAWDNDNGNWTLTLEQKAGGQGNSTVEVHSGIVVNAAGAWADEVAASCDVPQIGLVPKVRTCMVFEDSGKHGFDARDPSVARWPFVFDGLTEDPVYFFPRSGMFTASPSDETPSLPADVFAGELEVAICAHRLSQLTHIQPRAVKHKWAGQRSFVVDDEAVLGRDPKVPSFIWAAALGGYGIQAGPALGHFVASQALKQPLPEDLEAVGLSPDMVSAGRLATWRENAASTSTGS